MSRFKKWKTSFKAKLPRKSRNGPVEALVEPKAESTLPPQSLEKGDFSAYDSPPGSSARSSYLSSRDSSAPFASSSDSSYSADSKPPAPSQREVPAGSPDTIEAEEAEEEWFISRAYEEAIEKTQTRYKDNASEICNILRDAIEQPKTRYNSTKEVLKEHDWVLELMENVLSGVANLVSAWPPAQCALVGLVAVIKVIPDTLTGLKDLRQILIQFSGLYRELERSWPPTRSLNKTWKILTTYYAICFALKKLRNGQTLRRYME